MNTRALCLVLAAMSMAGCANFSGLDTQGQRLDANTFNQQGGKLISQGKLTLTADIIDNSLDGYIA
ncbi:multidrug RND transporter, partial [Pseudomonas sp. TNT11]|nr:multidrug RND transporter [Pseudomonas emilianonis]